MDDDQEIRRRRRFLVLRPKALQYFHNGRVHKESEDERQAGRFELFLDLLYVALVANFADDFAQHATGVGLAKYILIFAPAWHAWSDIKELMNSYFNDDLAQRTFILWEMALLVIYGNNAVLVNDKDPVVALGALRTTVGAYLVARFSAILLYIFNSLASRYHRYQNQLYAALTAIGLCIWTPLFFENVSTRAKVAVAAVAIVYEESIWVLSFSPWIKKCLRLTYSTAVDIPHEIDRSAAFYIIVLGEYLYSIIAGSPAAVGLNYAALRAVWTLVIAFCLNWLYVNADGSMRATHPLRRSVVTAFIWIMVHLPLAMALLIGGHMSALSVRETAFSDGQRWLWGGGLGAGLAILWLIAMCFASNDERGTMTLPKYARMLPRLLVALVMALLPLADAERLDANRFVSVCAGLFVFVVIWETVGGLEKGARVFESWKGSHEESLNETMERIEALAGEPNRFLEKMNGAQ